MRVLHILEATGGGTRRHVLDLLPALQKRGAHCSLAYSALRNPYFREDAVALQRENIECHEIAMGHSYQRACDANALRRLHAHLRANKYDLIHCHSSNAGLLGRIANALQRKSTPLVYTPHYIALAAGLPPLQRRAARWLEKWLAPQTDHFIAVSRHEYSVLQRARLLKNRNATVVYNGVDISAFDNQLAVNGAAPVIGCFGRLTAQKNQQLLIRALPRIAREFPNVRLCLVGDGEDEAALRALAARLEVEEYVEWRGDVRDTAQEYSRCDIVAQPSRWEGCSYALLEAMASGKAILASPCGGNPEVIGSAGVLLPARDVAAWARAFSELLRDGEKRSALGEAARERVGLHFRLETMVEKTLRVYERVLR